MFAVSERNAKYLLHLHPYKTTMVQNFYDKDGEES
jgi:hypothetical protein